MVKNGKISLYFYIYPKNTGDTGDTGDSLKFYTKKCFTFYNILGIIKNNTTVIQP